MNPYQEIKNTENSIRDFLVVQPKILFEHFESHTIIHRPKILLEIILFYKYGDLSHFFS